MRSGLAVRSRVRLSRRWVMVPLMVAGLSLGAVRPAIADNELQRVLTVSGQGIENIATTTAQVQLGVEAQGSTAAEVQRQVAARSSRVVDYLRSRNVRKLQTTGISLNPVYNYSNNEQRIVGYSASNMVSFEIETEEAGVIMDESVRRGASRINGISFSASEEAIARAQQQALREATQDAQTQADAVLSTLGLTRREVVGIQVNAARPQPMPRPYAMMAEARADAPRTPVVGGEQQVQASVTLQIRY